MRARNLKPGFFKNEELAELPFEARLLFAGLWCMADREGRLEDRPKRIKAEVFPYDAVNIEKLLEQLRTARSIVRYTVEGHDGGIIWIPTFKRHQNPHKNEKPSELPAYRDIAKLREDSGAKTEPLGLNPSSLNPSSLNPDIPVGVAETATDADECAGIDFGEEGPEEPKKPEPKLTPGQELVGYYARAADIPGAAKPTDRQKGIVAQIVGQKVKGGVKPDLVKKALFELVDQGQEPQRLAALVDKWAAAHRRSGPSTSTFPEEPPPEITEADRRAGAEIIREARRKLKRPAVTA